VERFPGRLAVTLPAYPAQCSGSNLFTPGIESTGNQQTEREILAWSLAAIVLMCGALPLLMMGMSRKQKHCVICADARAAVAITTTIVGLTVGN